MASSYDINNQLRACGAKSIILSKAEARCLPSIIQDGEIIRAFIYGSHPGGFGMMVATEHRLLFISKVFFDTKVDELPYNSVSGVEYDLGIRYGKLKVFTRAKEFEFKFVHKRYLRPFVDYVNQQVIAAQRYMPTRDESEVGSESMGQAKRPSTYTAPVLNQLKERMHGSPSSRPFISD